MGNEKHIFADAASVAAWIAPLRAEGKTVVTTNGCFDIIHAGHVQYLEEAAACGDILVVGLNSDESVGRLKGPSRPLQSEDDRLHIMAALRSVSAAFIFREDDPRAFIDIIKPDVHVKGGDYGADILERPVVESHGGTIRILSFKDGRSTTGIVRKMTTGS